ncbi:unnamed protein product [Lactuca virosa]|uniref:Uncharacterized protein n=1 Tax=Lactuca virosa TaxID=75947 RepID=A0AAU9PJH2_9ASTR|nr:unnamed protein product [Lactuca virosa]
MDHLTYANIENEIVVDDIDDDLGNEDAVLFEEQLEEPQLEKEIGSTSLLDHGKYDVPDDAKTWVLRRVGNLYKAKEIRKSLKNMHTAGPKSFATIRDEMEQMKKYEHLEDESDIVDPYMIVMKKGNDGYRRLYGRDVTNRLIKKSGWW